MVVVVVAVDGFVMVSSSLSHKIIGSDVYTSKQLANNVMEKQTASFLCDKTKRKKTDESEWGNIQ